MIRLRSLVIQNFRGIREGRLDGFADVTLLIGRNNCGKTTVFEALMRCVQEWGQSKDFLGRDWDKLWANIRQESTNDAMDIGYRHSTASEVSVSADSRISRVNYRV